MQLPAEAILFGNAGRTGSAKSLSFSGSNASGSVFATGAASIGIPLPISLSGQADEQFALGVTGKYIKAIGVVRAQDNGSVITPNNIAGQFPVIHTPQPDQPTDLLNNDGGHGMGVDVGLAWSSGGTTFSATARNVVNTFKWNTSGLKAILGSATFDGTTNASKFDDTLYSLAPATMRAALEAEKFQPEIAAGIAKRSGSFLLLTALSIPYCPICFHNPCWKSCWAKNTSSGFILRLRWNGIYTFESISSIPVTFQLETTNSQGMG